MNQHEINGCLYAFLQTAYHFEKQEKILFSLSWQEIYLLQLLRRRGSWQISRLGAKLELKKYQISRLVSRLEAMNMVRRTAHTQDRRNVHVEILEAGRTRLAEIEAYHHCLFETGERLGGPGTQTLEEFHNAVLQFATMVGINVEEYA